MYRCLGEWYIIRIYGKIILEFQSYQNWLRLTTLIMFLVFHTHSFQITKRPHILKQTCSYHLHISLRVCDLLVNTRHWRVKVKLIALKNQIMKSVAKKKTHLLLRNTYKGKKGKKNLEIKKIKKKPTQVLGILTSAWSKLNVRLIYVGK